MALTQPILSAPLKLNGAGKLAFLARAFTASRTAQGFGSHTSDNDPKVVDSQKENVEAGTKKSSMKSHPGWSEELASDSESAVKADKDDHHAEDHDEHLEKLQSHTVDHIKEVHKDE